MFFTDAPANDSGQYTEGNPGLGVPATVVSAEHMNALQNELAEVITFAGLSLNTGDSTQLRQAVQALIGLGGGTQIKQSIANNTAAVNITGLVFDKADVKSAQVYFDVERRTDSQDVQESGILYVAHDTNAGVWRISKISGLDDSGVIFTITSSGQIKIETDDLTGTSYDGQFRATNVITLDL